MSGWPQKLEDQDASRYGWFAGHPELELLIAKMFLLGGELRQLDGRWEWFTMTPKWPTVFPDNVHEDSFIWFDNPHLAYEDFVRYCQFGWATEQDGRGATRG